MEDRPIQNVVQKEISNFWGTLRRLSFDYTFKNGKVKRLTHEVYGKSDGVAILLYNPETRRIILTKQFRAPVWVAQKNQSSLVEVCGGAIDGGEDPMETVKREAVEEVGIAPTNIKFVSQTFLSPGILSEKIFLYTGEYKSEQLTTRDGGVFEEGEEIEVLEITYDKAFAMIKSGELLDARTLILLQHLLLIEST
ncbi:MAG: NUDIX domain-containing protein [Flavobacteriaceae bacterium]|nr:NUDIX domain-containing protein [Flavobacteriaceae bacterium]|tara:strand:- start:5355 stop:5939 length:585 start_codon:yes stop_codon:yes gene_type:complete